MSKCQYYGERNKNLSKEQKQKLVEYIRNYYITHKKWLLGHFIDILKIPAHWHFVDIFKIPAHLKNKSNFLIEYCESNLFFLAMAFFLVMTFFNFFCQFPQDCPFSINPESTKQKLNYELAKALSNSYTLDNSCKCSCLFPHKYA